MQPLRTRMILANAPRESIPTDLLDIVCTASIDFTAAEDEKKPVRFSMVAYTGTALNLGFWPHPVVIDLEGLQIPAKSLPILHQHSAWSVVGHTDKAEISGNELRVEGVISGANQIAREITESSKRGFPWQSSVGARALRLEFVEEGAKVTVNGMDFKGPVYVARESKLKEISFVALGADENTSAKVAASQRQTLQGKEPAMDFEAWIKAKGLVLAELTEENKAALRVLYDAEVKAAADAPDGTPDAGTPAPKPDIAASGAPAPQPKPQTTPVEDLRAQMAAEQERLNAIRAACGDAHGDIAAKAIGEGWSKERTELEVLRASRPQAPAILQGGDGDMSPRVIEAAIRLGSEEPAAQVEAAYDERILEAAHKHRRMGIRGLIDLCCRLEGRPVPGLSDGPEIWAAAGFSTVNVPGILGNTANKLLVSAFNAVPSAAVKVARKLSAKDFKTHTGYRVGDGTIMEKIGGAGELKHGDLTEGSFTFFVDTYGEIIGISRRAWINDDLGAFTTIPLRIGRKAARTRESIFWTLVKANTGSFFASDNNNVSTSTGVDTAGYDAATKVMEEMTDDDGNEVLIVPKYVVVPPALAGAARRMYKSSNLAVVQLGSTSAKKLEGLSNNYDGMYEPLSVPHLRSGSTNGSDTTFYLFADPSDVAAFGIAYLNGIEAPTVEEAPLPSDCLGKAWRGYLDLGVCQIDEQGAVKCDA